MRKVVNRLRMNQGLTLVEVLVVIAIISIILAVALPNYTESTSRAQQKMCEATQKMVEAQLELYKIENPDKTLPSGSEIAKLVEEKYLKEEPKCPSGGEYTVSGTDLICDKHSDEND
jgi:competence protein ComGC